MGESKAFDIACSYLERSTGLERPAARGTVRLALKEAGLDPETVTADQLAVVTEKLLPAELRALRISDVDGHCHSLRAHLRRLDEGNAGAAAAGPEAVFERLADS
jgi:hypothetical protein